MLQYRKSNDQPDQASFDDLVKAVAAVTTGMGGGQKVVVPEWLRKAVAAGKSEALTHLAGLHLGAFRSGQGMAEAAPLLRTAAQNGYAPAQEQLGIISLFGVGCEPAPGEAAGWLRLAADQGAKRAQSLLGMMLAAGAGIEQDLSQAKEMLTRAEEQGNADARSCLRAGSNFGLLPQIATFFLGSLRIQASVSSILSGDAGDAEIEREITKLAEGRDAIACLLLSTLSHSRGSRAEALRWCLAAADAGDELAVLVVGLLAFVDDDIRHKYPVAEWLNVAANQGSAPAQGLLGVMYETGRGVGSDSAEAGRLLGQAAEGMDTTVFGGLFAPQMRPYLEAMTHFFAKLLIAQLGREETPPVEGPFNFVREAMRLAEQGDCFAQFFVGLALSAGQGVTQDQATGARWMQEAARQGYKEAQYHTGIHFSLGHGVESDQKEAMRWFRLAAEQGHTEAQFSLACAFKSGNGVEKDLAEAARWFELAAEQGDASAQVFLAKAFKSGEGVEKDLAEAARWFRLAAEQGDPSAQFGLASLLITGDGGEEDLESGVQWLLQAAKQGSKEAIKILQRKQLS